MKGVEVAAAVAALVWTLDFLFPLIDPSPAKPRDGVFLLFPCTPIRRSLAQLLPSTPSCDFPLFPESGGSRQLLVSPFCPLIPLQATTR